jgi:hypothetical protein
MSQTSWMFRPPFVVIFKDMFLKDYYKDIKTSVQIQYKVVKHMILKYVNIQITDKIVSVKFM